MPWRRPEARVRGRRRAAVADGDDDTGVLLGTWTAGGQSTQQFLDALFRSGPVRSACAALRQHGRQLGRRPDGTRVQAARAEHHRQSQGSVRARRDCRRGRSAARGSRARRWSPAASMRVFETFFKAHDRFHVMSPDATPCARLRAVRSPAQRLRDGRGRVHLPARRSASRLPATATSSAWRRPAPRFR